MNQKVALAVVITALTLSVCFIAAASASDRPYFFSDIQHIDSLQKLSASVPIVVGTTLHSNPLDQPTRLEIYSYIKDNPGVHFRGKCDGLGLSVGVVQYHLSVLEHAGLINAMADGQNKRYFEHNTFRETDAKLVSLMRHNTTAKILTILAQKGPALHRDIPCCLGISSQAVTWQMNQLKNAGIISSEKVGVNVRYSLIDADVSKLIIDLNHQFKN